MVKPLIVGVDVGLTTGIAIFDLDRNLLFLGNKRFFSVSDVINYIMRFGKPLIIATDKKKIPATINKLAATFNCKVFNPDHDLGVEEKDEIVKIPIKDIHEKDALAAATFAYKAHVVQFTNIDRTLASMNLKEYKDTVKEMIITKEAKNIAEAIEKIKPKKEEIPTKQVLKEIKLDWKEKAKEYEKKLDEQKKRYEILKIYDEKLDEKIKSLERQKQAYLEEEMRKNEETRKKILKEKELKSRDILIKQLQFELAKQKSFSKIYEEEIEREKELKDIENDDLIPVVIVSDFTRESINNANRIFDIRNKFIWFKNVKTSNSALNMLKSLKPKAVIANMDKESKEFLKDSGIVIVSDIEPELKRFYAFISPEEVNNVIKKTEKKDFLNWLEEYRKR